MRGKEPGKDLENTTTSRAKAPGEDELGISEGQKEGPHSWLNNQGEEIRMKTYADSVFTKGQISTC